MGNHKDKLIKESLEKGTDPSVEQKEKIWSAIENRLDQLDSEAKDSNVHKLPSTHEAAPHVHDMGKQQLERGKNNMKKTRTAKSKKWVIITATAAGLLLATMFATATEQGQAFISQIRQWFEPEKEIEQELEGMPEETDVNLHEGESKSEEEADFIIYVDEERYEVIENDDVFRIEADIPADYPDVYMEITQNTSIDPQDAINEIHDTLLDTYPVVRDIEQVEDPVSGYSVRALGGQEWDSEVVVYYVVSNELEGSFIIKQQYFLEAAEGHGARMFHMLREFQVVRGEPQE
ncbi:hypothetical protein [Caldalkalibacillus salinus]|uniref:hypothetical protein n=1 Tax=Caldalkalibacillus salinus TaxID=2803787 RepID=UPI0019243512|nr:hypothetical protein [Caldalkalibacillus salinus]